ncbi:hypothetical protein GQX74_015221 [Glossina fuscipes]|nr:hypothetical protein GQX74_015221 [Glossina fuscipes]
MPTLTTTTITSTTTVTTHADVETNTERILRPKMHGIVTKPKEERLDGLRNNNNKKKHVGILLWRIWYKINWWRPVMFFVVLIRGYGNSFNRLTFGGRVMERFFDSINQEIDYSQRQRWFD